MNAEPLKISIIVPVFNRPNEIEELLESLGKQTNKNFELVIVEDGSSITCEKVVAKFKDLLTIKYFFKENTGPGISRNFGCNHASGNYFIFVDSDCILPPSYVEVVYKNLHSNYVDAFGGPDQAHESFSPLQKAINYSMTSFLTTGGIRGGGEKLDKFYPRSFNMGFSKTVFERTGGFPSVFFAAAKAAGEDIELSVNIRKEGFTIGLFKEAFVYHKRRVNLKQFYKQVYNFGYARVSLAKRNKGSLKIVHLFPSFFVVGIIGLIVLSVWFSIYFLAPLLLFVVLLLTDALRKTKSLEIAFIAVFASFIQIIGYGIGFLISFWKQMILPSKN